MSSGSTLLAGAWPISPSTVCSRCSTAARSRPAWRWPTATPSPWSRTWAWWPPSSTSAPCPASQGHMAIGHTRYSTHGASDWAGAQPVYRPVGRAGFALGPQRQPDQHRRSWPRRSACCPGSIATDSDVVAELLAQAFPETEDLTDALQAVLPIVEGAFSFVLMNSQRLFGVRDPFGFRPLCLGRFGPADAPEGWVLASETPALSVIGATFVREVDPGEMVVIDADGVHSLAHPLAEGSRAPALHLRVRLHRPTRQQALRPRGARDALPHGRAAGRQAPAEADMVMGVPESGVPAAEGFARASGIPYGQGLVKNRYIGRTFIAPDQQARADAVRRKLNPLTRPSPASGWWWWTTPSSAAPPSGRSSACCARPEPRRCTCASRRRRGAGPASTASTPRRTTSCWPPTTPLRR